jgi:nucleotide-binding universal stress UspA family protein
VSLGASPDCSKEDWSKEREAMMVSKDILAIVTSCADDESVISLAEQLVDRNAGSLTTLVVGWMPTIAPVVEGWVVDPTWGEVVKQAQDQLREEKSKVARRVAQKNERAPVESRFLQVGAARPIIGMRARHSDLAVVRRPDLDSGDAIVEGPLFESGRPIIVVPPDWKNREIGRSIVVCWKPTREASRALADAADLLAGADRVTVVTVDAKPAEDGYGEHPGADIAAHLARRKLDVELVNLDSMGRTAAEAIQDHAVAVHADLIVMGGYGRSRLSEFIFGGLTREMLQTSSLPILMAH